MKKQLFILSLALCLATAFSSCKKDKTDPPSVTTGAVVSITETAATINGEVTVAGTSDVTARGMCWSTAPEPTVEGSKTTSGTGLGAFTSELTGLTPGTLYYVRAYATNADGTAYGEQISFTTSSLIKTIGVVYTDGVEKYEFTYDDATKRIVKIDDYWNDVLDKTITYDYSVPGKLTITSGTNATVYDINEDGMVVKEDWGGGEYAAYEYDDNGYLVKIIEHWGGVDHVKMEAVITDNKIMQHTSYTDDGVAKKIKTFVYTNGDNNNNIFQASMVDSNTKPMGNLFGKSSSKLVDYLEYWDPRVTPIEKGKTTITYTFDEKNRPSSITRAGSGWQELYTYTYY